MSSLIDFSSLISNDVLSYMHLNEKFKNYEYVANELSFSSSVLAIPEQIHSSNVVIADKPGLYYGVDGLVTNISNIILCLKVADCVPIFLFGLKSKVVGLVHAGWRGTINGIVQHSVKKMLELGVNIKEIKIYLGPSIGKCCYEVNNDVAVYFNKEMKIKLKNHKWKVGIKEQIRYFLIETGVLPENIEISNICTFEKQKYHSYRREKGGNLRMYSIIGKKC